MYTFCVWTLRNVFFQKCNLSFQSSPVKVISHLFGPTEERRNKKTTRCVLLRWWSPRIFHDFGLFRSGQAWRDAAGEGWNGNEAFISKLFHEGNTTVSLWKRALEQQNSVSILSWSLRLKRATCENSGPVEPGPLQISDFRPIRARPRSGRRRHTGEFLRPVAIATEHCGVSVNVCVRAEKAHCYQLFFISCLFPSPSFTLHLFVKWFEI